jgi:hypothetical protein
MLYTLTDEESVQASDEQIKRVAEAFASVCSLHKGTSVDALSMVLWMVNGGNWISASDMARAKVKAKGLGVK